LEKINRIQERIKSLMPEASVPTKHWIHGGMYARTVTMSKDMVITGALIKKPTMICIIGAALVVVGDEFVEVQDCIVPASAGRKQLFIALGPVELTMIFATSAKTVEEAENEFTDEAELLLSRRQDGGIITITGE
jgi:hypothetical protein